MTAVQLSAFDPLEEAFVAWLRTDHGRRVEAAFRDAAIAWVNAGHRAASAKMLTEAIRWEAGKLGHDPDGYAINNSYVSRLARHVVATTDELPADLFRHRRLRSAEVAL